MLTNLVASLIRTLAPMCAGLLIAWLVRQGVSVDDSYEQPLTEILTVAFGAVYYVVARLLERKWPVAGWMLGYPKQPDYGAAKEAAQEIAVKAARQVEAANPDVPPKVQPPPESHP
jgi:hypothetical protein